MACLSFVFIRKKYDLKLCIIITEIMLVNKLKSQYLSEFFIML